jgi:hypothetical protein
VTEFNKTCSNSNHAARMPEVGQLVKAYAVRGQGRHVGRVPLPWLGHSIKAARRRGMTAGQVDDLIDAFWSAPGRRHWTEFARLLGSRL